MGKDEHILVLLRHGESIWNKKNIFTGWTDVDLSRLGIKQAHRAAKMLKENGFVFDIAFTSFLKRAIKTLWIILEDMDLMWIEVRKSWRLNERHYGALQGLNKARTAKIYGEKQVFLWRRSFDIRPPALSLDDERYPGKDIKYRTLKPSQIPRCESLKDTLKRVLPYWRNEIIPAIKKAKNGVLISAHGNSLRALIKHIDNIPDKDIANLNIPMAIPIVYKFDKKMRPIEKYYLGNKKTIIKLNKKYGSRIVS